MLMRFQQFMVLSKRLPSNSYSLIIKINSHTHHTSTQVKHLFHFKADFNRSNTDQFYSVFYKSRLSLESIKFKSILRQLDNINMKEQIYPAGKYYGQFHQGKRHGQGSMYYKNGDLYVGKWNSDQREGEGKLIKFNSTTIGTWSNDCKAFGVECFRNGDRYEGSYKNENSAFTGRGTIYFANGSIYEGQHRNLTQIGIGKMYYLNGNIFQGLHLKENSKKEGTMSYANGSRLEGRFDQHLHVIKQGTYYFDLLSIYHKYQGEFYNNRFEGKGVLEYKSKDVYVGHFVHGFFQGVGTFTWSNGSVYEGQFIGGKMNDLEGVLITNDGEVFRGEFRGNQMHGKISHKNKQNSKTSSEQYRNGVLISKVQEKIPFKETQIFRAWTYYGQVSWQNYKHGFGTQTVQNQSYEGEWLNNKKHGYGLFKKGENIYEGEWSKGYHHGDGISYTKEFRQEKQMINGQQGINIKYQNSGRRIERIKPGFGVIYYSSGEIYIGALNSQFQAQKGEHIRYFANGDRFQGCISISQRSILFKKGTFFRRNGAKMQISFRKYKNQKHTFSWERRNEQENEYVEAIYHYPPSSLEQTFKGHYQITQNDRNLAFFGDGSLTWKNGKKLNGFFTTIRSNMKGKRALIYNSQRPFMKRNIRFMPSQEFFKQQIADQLQQLQISKELMRLSQIQEETKLEENQGFKYKRFFLRFQENFGNADLNDLTQIIQENLDKYLENYQKKMKSYIVSILEAK